jgi:uncharacterized cupredoxin-like copper-binding protein
VAVNVTEREWRITADLQTVDAGPVKFSAINLGTIEHELVVIRTDYPDGAIPLDGDAFGEDAPGVASPGEISEYKVDTVAETVVELEPGHYQLVCNLPTHYRNGMHIPFDVLASS